MHAKSLSCAVENLPFLNADFIVLAAGPTSPLVSSYTAVLVLVLELPSEILVPALDTAWQNQSPYERVNLVESEPLSV